MQNDFSGNLKATDIPDLEGLPELESIGNYSAKHFLDDPQQVFLDGNFVYTSNIDSIAKFNIVNPQKLVFVGISSYDLNPYRIAVDGEIAYIAYGDNGWSIYNISNITNCQLLASNDTASCYKVVLMDNIVFFGNYIYNVTDPINPVEIFTLPDYFKHTETAYQITSSYLIATNDSGYFEIYNISDPCNIHLHSSFNVSYSYYTEIVCADDNTLVIHDFGNYSFYNISNINNISYSSSLDLDYFQIYRGALLDKNNFHIFYNRYHVIYDISNLTNITLLTTSKISYSPWMIAINESLAYIIDSYNFLFIEDLTDLSNPIIIDSFDFGSNGAFKNIEIKGKYAIVAQERGFFLDGVFILNIEDPTDPYFVHYILVDKKAMVMKIIGEVLYIFEWQGDLTIYDLSDQDNIQEVGNLVIPLITKEYTGFIKLDNKALLFTRFDGYFILDITNPISPSVIDHNDIGFCYQMEIKENLMYVWQFELDGFVIYDVTDIFNPEKIASVLGESGEWYPRRFKIYNDILYLEAFFNWNFTDTYRLWTYDITDPYNPIFLEELINFKTNYYKMELDGSFLYISISYLGTAIYDLREPEFKPIAKCKYIQGDIKFVEDYLYFSQSNRVEVLKALAYSSQTSDLVKLNTRTIYCIVFFVLILQRTYIHFNKKRKVDV